MIRDGFHLLFEYRGEANILSVKGKKTWPTIEAKRLPYSDKVENCIRLVA